MLLGVVVVIVVAALIGYHYSDRMVSEYQGAVNAHRSAQLRCIADSGVHYAAMALATPDNITNILNGSPYDNPEHFKKVHVGDLDNSGQGGYFTFLAPIDPDQNTSSSSVRYGVTDETGKININAFIKRDPTGELLYNMLIKLPILSTSTDLAAAIVDYVDADSDTREGGAEDDTYSGESPSRRCKNGPLDSLEELLLVRGMSKEILFGADLNRNGFMAPDGSPISTPDRGLSAFLTVYSRESNRDNAGQPLVNLNGDDLTVLSDKLSPLVPPEVLNFIILLRQYGPVASTASTLRAVVQTATGTAAATVQSTTPATPTGNLSNYEPDLTMAGSKKLTSVLDLLGAQVSVPGAMGKAATVYASPLTDLTTIGDTLTTLFQVATVSEDPEIAARINVNTAPREVLMCIDGLTETDVEAIITARPRWGGVELPTTEFQSLGWLASQAKLPIATLKNLEKVLTTRSSVFHMQIVGQFENGMGSTARVEAIVDANYGRPRIVYYRDWSELGRTKLPE